MSKNARNPIAALPLHLISFFLYLHPNEPGVHRSCLHRLYGRSAERTGNVPEVARSALASFQPGAGSFHLNPPLRVALFTDSFHEANGVATLSREFAEFARRQALPLFCAHSGSNTGVSRDESLTTMELKRGFASFALDHDLRCDPLLSRYKKKVLAQLRVFRPDAVHITGPGDMGILGLWMAHLLHIPLIASWHTNLHEYAGRRLEKTFSFLPTGWRARIAAAGEAKSLAACLWFYHYPRFTMAPNRTMAERLEAHSGRPSFLMSHGVDTERFSPVHRRRSGGPFRIGYVGRLTTEKNVRLLAGLERALLAKGKTDFRIVMVGDGSERDWLRRNLRQGELPGVLRGEALAQAFADMDVFVFPSRTDTFGLVLLEAMASGVPPVVTEETAVRVGIRNGVTGFHADDLPAVANCVTGLMRDREMGRPMREAAREFACSRSWSGVFQELYQIYENGLARIGRARQHMAEIA